MRFFFSKDHQELNQNLISFYQDLNQERPIPDSDPDSEPESGSESDSESVPDEFFFDRISIKYLTDFSEN